MMDEQKIKEITYDYVLAVSNNIYKLQALANKNILDFFGKEKMVEILSIPVNEFCQKYKPFKVRDFVYKNDFFTPRNVYLINPLYYTYYTYLVFSLVNKLVNEDGTLTFSRKNMKIFYAGLFDKTINQKELKRNARYNDSYKMYQEEREKHLGKPAIKLDIQEFFNSIKVPKLILKLKEIFGHVKIVDDLEFFLEHCEIVSLPQFHNSIASSILSQLYLTDFDTKLQNLIIRHGLEYIRYVDDMYIVDNRDEYNRKKSNRILNEISYYLWEESLVLNTTKTKMLSADEYKDIIEIFEPDYEINDFNQYSREKRIEDKAIEVVDEGSLNHLVTTLCDLESQDGIDMERYRELTKQYLAIEGDDVNKVLSNIIYSEKWKRLDVFDLLELVSNWRYILFNPSHFTVLYILVYSYLLEGSILEEDDFRISKILNYLYERNVFTFRDTVVAVSYLIQNNINNEDLLNKIGLVSPEYVEYLRTYIKNFN
ncbi:reverse transcriptase domain-containing protein [Metabacillus halosaccharovorans]|uniref:reverse transcriptase domain-containing protein n=1 Tax=Metabacillus halosaccharovorans TaxID=930124 RepID=UPI001C1F39E4|nr:reverse transcriptase domain-containing protein [Metabacillus halosaccharovorans]MBU7595640.1 hypothetical protein [Metabacillus halosaccharovorans]